MLVVERRKGIKKCSSGPTAAAAEYDVAALVYLVLCLAAATRGRGAETS